MYIEASLVPDPFPKLASYQGCTSQRRLAHRPASRAANSARSRRVHGRSGSAGGRAWSGRAPVSAPASAAVPASAPDSTPGASARIVLVAIRVAELLERALLALAGLQARRI